MIYQINLSSDAQRSLERMISSLRIRIERALESLEQNPFGGKKLHGEYKNCYSIRIWPYRVLYEIYKKHLIVNVIRIAHRKDVYR